ncbi:tRNA (adenosine(37)-N6)-dimethylallyltransferase MiaA [Peptoniphilus sp. EMRHCC_23]|uniref:tRNA (adenosine(37)-N6)-dimethylallyltransferase MiaA n=1 Tax=Peptoniphilus rachelemmaiella TaxID=2811779 RepID=UPI001C006F1E|nr:tRNA (adenosine(37)-N6)-dimethylallyltransferase MiaA [Peptoniphilus rachelemmaiella]
MKPLILITGPTGSGKSDLSVALAKKLQTEIISADSVQVYRGFTIGSGKIMPRETVGIIHHLIDIKEPEEFYSAADFYEAAAPIFEDLWQRGKIPIVCGGTALYIHSLIYDLNFSEKPSSESRNQLNRLYEKHGLSYMVDLLKEKDVTMAEAVDLNNPRRVIRALERIESGHVETEQLRKKRKGIDPLYIVLDWAREDLYTRINRRVLKMVDAGLFDEVDELYKAYGSGVKPMGSIGYKEVVKYLKGEWDKATAIEKIQQHSRNFAKRQMTWFRKEEDAVFIPMSELTKDAALEKILELEREKYGRDCGFKGD